MRPPRARQTSTPAPVPRACARPGRDQPPKPQPPREHTGTSATYKRPPRPRTRSPDRARPTQPTRRSAAKAVIGHPPYEQGQGGALGRIGRKGIGKPGGRLGPPATTKRPRSCSRGHALGADSGEPVARGGVLQHSRGVASHGRNPSQTLGQLACSQPPIHFLRFRRRFRVDVVLGHVFLCGGVPTPNSWTALSL